jgi:hypothetical protein
MTTKDPFTVILRGHSDDILYIAGALDEELYPSREAQNSQGTDEADVLAFSDGSLLRVRYDGDGVWRLTFALFGPGTIVTKTDGTMDSGSDEVILKAKAPFQWAILGPSQGLVKVRKPTGGHDA